MTKQKNFFVVKVKVDKKKKQGRKKALMEYSAILTLIILFDRKIKSQKVAVKYVTSSEIGRQKN